MEEPIKVRLDEFLNSMMGDGVAINGEVVDETDGVAKVVLDPQSVAIVGDSPFTGLLADDIELLLKAYGVEEPDMNMVRLILFRIQEIIKNHTNLDEVPEGLHYKVVFAVCAEYLNFLFSMGKLKIEVASPVESIKEGDTEVKYVSGSNPQKLFQTVIDSMRLNTSELSRYRVMLW